MQTSSHNSHRCLTLTTAGGAHSTVKTGMETTETEAEERLNQPSLDISMTGRELVAFVTTTTVRYGKF